MQTKKKNLLFWRSVWLGITFMLIGTAQAQPTLPDLTKLDWLFLGPLPIPAQAENWADVKGFQTDYLAEIGGEAEAQPKAGQPTQSQVWQKLSAPPMPVNLLSLFGNAQDCVAYAYVEFEYPTAQAVGLKLGSDDGLKVWFNGKLLASDHVHRGLQPDEDAIPVNLQAGLNRLLLKIDQGTGAWEFTARFAAIADEQQAWTKATAPGLKICPLERVIANPAEFACTVLTVPGFAVSEPVEVVVMDEQGEALVTVSSRTGELIPLALPQTFTGLASIQVKSTGKTPTLTAHELILVGDPERVGKEVVHLARSQAEQATVKEQGEVLVATLTFYADVIEQKVHPSLASSAQTIRAIETLKTLTTLIQKNAWNADAFRGLHQWAYKSPIDEALQPYTLYVPETYTAQKQYGLIVALHGYNGNDYDAATTIIKPQVQPDDFLLVAPYGRGDVGYLSVGEQDVLDVMERIQAAFSIQPDRIYLTGFSMGGLGTWRIGQHFADKFAAMAPFCGWTGTDYLANLYNLPTLIVHGDTDNTVPVSMDRAAAEQLKQWHYPVQYDELPGVGHDAWGAWVKETGGNRILEYFRQYWRNPWPAEVVLKTNYPRYGKSFWVRMLELAQPPQNGTLKASFVDATHITVAAEQVSAFALNLTHPQLSQTAPIIVTINGVAVTVAPAQAAATFRRQDAGWLAVQEPPVAATIPHDGGGPADLFVRPLLIVYGTQQRAQIYQQAATMFADWRPTPHIPIGSKTGRFLVKADTDVTAAEMQQYHLFLLGGPEHNLITKQLAAKLPVKFSEDKVNLNGQEFAPAGIVLTYPNPLAPTKLVGILTLPFPDEQIERFMPTASLRFWGYNVQDWATLPRFMPDVTVYKSLEPNTPALWEGWFDEQWQHLRQY